MQNFTDDSIKDLVIYNQGIQEEVKSIFEEYFKDSPIKYFFCRIFYKDCLSLSYITNSMDWLEFRIKKELSWFPQAVTVNERKKLETDSNFLWIGKPHEDDPIYKNLYDFGIWNGISLYESSEEGVAVFGFGQPRDQSNIDFYVNKRHLFSQYIMRFKATKAYKNKKYCILSFKIPYSLPGNNQYSQDNYVCAIKDGPFYILLNGKDVKFTRRQLQCLICLSQGLSYKEIAALLSTKASSIGQRTIESYIKDIRQKTGYFSTGKLIQDF